jgi:hypothetical protein
MLNVVGLPPVLESSFITSLDVLFSLSLDQFLPQGVIRLLNTLLPFEGLQIHGPGIAGHDIGSPLHAAIILARLASKTQL